MTTDVRKIGFNVLLGIAAYMPLEDYVLRWLPVPDRFLPALHQVPDALVLAVALGAATLHLAKRGTIRIIGSHVDRYLAGFILVALASIYLNGANLLDAVLNLKALVRYIPLIYALIMLAPDDAQLARIPRVVLVAFGIQIAIGSIEWLGGEPARAFFSVYHIPGRWLMPGVFVASVSPVELTDVTGTMGRPVAYGYFLLAGLAVWLVQHEKRPVLSVIGVVLTLVLTFLSNSRMAVFGVILVLFMHQIAMRGIKKTLILALKLSPLALMVVIVLGSKATEAIYVLDVFTQEYREHALTQRLGLITYILPHVFNGGIPLFGYSPDLAAVAAAVGEHFELPAILTYVFIMIVEDVYWLALLLFYGVIGFALFSLFFGKLTALMLRIYRTSPTSTAKKSSLVAVLLLLLAIPLNGVNQAFEIRQFAYYLWLFVGAAIVSVRNADPITANLGGQPA